ncbi:hypothetical protein [Micromonospora globbae]|uniref:hypothetical protein n=1 Tax=Micromonospora globbae TaxID=1894969 RepID=UPI0034190A84
MAAYIAAGADTVGLGTDLLKDALNGGDLAGLARRTRSAVATSIAPTRQKEQP